MALIKCPECGKDVSDRSAICVHCGFPLSERKAIDTERMQSTTGIVARGPIYLHSKDSMSVAIECSCCKTVYNYMRMNFDSITDEECIPNKPIICSKCKNGVPALSTIRKRPTTNNTKSPETIEINKFSSPHKPVARCPRCGSASIQAMKRGFGLGRAVVGTVALGPLVGAVGGLIGSNKTKKVCLNCGWEW